MSRLLKHIIGRSLLFVLIIISIIVTVPLVIYQSPEPATFTLKNPNHNKNLALNEITPMAPIFADRTLNLGVFHEHRQASKKVSDIVDVLGAGICIGDVDGDHIDDLVFTTGSGNTRNYGKPSWWQWHSSVTLYLNKIDYLLEQTAEFGLNFTEATMGCLLADLDNDGFNDLLITSVNGSRLYHNRRGKGFSPVDSFLAHSRRWNTCSTITDINHDGLADIYLCHYVHYQKNQRTLEVASGFDTGQHSRFDPQLYDGIANQLLINQGGLVFKDMTAEYFDGDDQDRTLSSLWGDFNDDQNIDLLVLNDTGSPSRLYLGNSRGLLEETDNLSSPLRLLASHFAALTPDKNLLITRPQGLGVIYLPTLMSSISGQLDTSWNNGINHTKTLHLSYWGGNSADFNLDGYYDLFLSAGLRQPDSYGPARTLKQKNRLLVKHQDIFHEAKSVNPTLAASSRSSGVTDLNLDGKPDIILANNNGAPQILLNQTPTESYWLALKIKTPLPVKLTLRQNKWEQNLTLGNRPLFLGSEQGFHTVTIPLNEPVEVTLNNHQQTKTLLPNSHYVIDGDDLLMVNRGSAKPDTQHSLFNTEDILSAPVFVKRAWLRKQLITPQRLRPDTLAKIQTLINNSDKQERESYRQLVTQQPARMELLPLYLSWARVGNNDTITDIVAKAALEQIRNLESDLSTAELLSILPTGDDNKFCQITDIFATWYEQEEAVTRTKYLAAPILIQQLQSKNPRRVSCAAHALAYSEHLTAAPALITSYSQLEDVESQYAVISALGMIRQRQADSFLQNIMEDYRDLQRSTELASQQAKLPVAVAIALNRLESGLGDQKLIELLREKVLLPSVKIAIIAELQWPQHLIHFTDNTLDIVSEILQGLSQRQPVATITPIHQLLLSTWQPRLASVEAVMEGMKSKHVFLRQQATALLPQLFLTSLLQNHADIPLDILALTQWPMLDISTKKEVLRLMPADWLKKVSTETSAVSNAVASIGLMSAPQSSKLLRWLANSANAGSFIDSTYCLTPYQTIYAHSHETTLANISLSGIAAALYTPVVADKYSAGSLAKWLGEQIQYSPEFLPCLARLQMTLTQAKKISLTILALPEKLETAKQDWLLSTQIVDRFVSNGINSRLNRQDNGFTHRYLNQAAINQITGKQLELLAKYPQGSSVRLFARLIQSSRPNNTEQTLQP